MRLMIGMIMIMMKMKMIIVMMMILMMIKRNSLSIASNEIVPWQGKCYSLVHLVVQREHCDGVGQKKNC